VCESKGSCRSYVKNLPIYEYFRDLKLSQSNQTEVDVLDILPNRIVHRISSFYRMPIEDLDPILSESDLIWTHSPFYSTCSDVYDKFGKIVYVIRDPRAVHVSMANFSQTDYMRKFFPGKYRSVKHQLSAGLSASISNWIHAIASLAQYAPRDSTYIVFFEELKRNPIHEVGKISKFLGVELSDEAIQRVVDSSSFSTMQKKNPNHLRSGKSKSWESDLTSFQKWYARLIAKPLLKAIGYDRFGSDSLNFDFKKIARISHNARRRARLFHLIYSLSVKLKLIN
jgi:aryl sulfotransferase